MILEIERIAITCGRMRIHVRVPDNAPLATTPEIADRALALYPTLAEHSCINSKGPTFESVISHTPIPHLLEHMIIAEQAILTGPDSVTTFVGTTERTGSHTATVEVSFVDDLVAIEALNRALETLSNVM